MKGLGAGVRALAPVLVVGVLAHVVLANPGLVPGIGKASVCEKPITYALRTVDPRFGITREEAEVALSEAAEVWNEARSTPLLSYAPDAELFVDLVYDERQEAIELGASISKEQKEYQEMRDEVDSLRARYTALRDRYEAAVREFDQDVREYEAEVERWNEQGGAPPKEYARLAARKAELSERQSSLGSQAVQVESLGRDINARVSALNALVVRLNANAETYNETLGHDFHQGNYVSDDSGKRITIYTFERKEELVRVLAHEFGHALGIGHVEGPESLMYSYNIGTDIALTEEDRLALIEICGE